jgi:hypothetical protein
MQLDLTLPLAQYDPNPLLDTLIARLELKNDDALCHALDIARPVLAHIRRRSLGVGAWLLQRMSEISNLSIADLRRLMGDQRTRMRVGTARIKRCHL